MVEIGCGRGQLTIPLAKLAESLRIIGVDSYGPQYRSWRKSFHSILLREKLTGRIRLVLRNYLHWLSGQGSNKYDGLISSEFLPDIGSDETRRFLKETYRIIRREGVTIHCFLSPSAQNARQRLLIEADSDPRWSKFPPKEWFSPQQKFVVQTLKSTGFERIRVRHLKSNLIVRGDAARALLKDWDVRMAFWKTYKKRLQSQGLEIPDWIAISAVKP